MSRIAYAYRDIGEAGRNALVAHGFRLRYHDALVAPNRHKNTLDLLLAMEACDDQHRRRTDAVALLVAGDTDFAVVAAFLRERYEVRTIAFGSRHCYNGPLSEVVDAYVLIDEPEAAWDARLRGEVRATLPRKLRKAALEIGPLLVEVAGPALGDPVPLRAVRAALNRLGAVAPPPDRLRRLLAAIGCDLSAAGTVMGWSPEVRSAVTSARRGRRAWRDPILRALEAALTGLTPPIELGYLAQRLAATMPADAPTAPKSYRFWMACEDLGFVLDERHTTLLGAAREPAVGLLNPAPARQLRLQLVEREDTS